ncbi:MAG: hypothetical protein ACOYOH_28795, partial [Paracraurococcus sp.]
MARLRLAQDLMAAGEAVPAREQVRLLAARSPAPPEAVVLHAWMLACGIGGPADPGGSAALVPRLRSLAADMQDQPEFAGHAAQMASGLAAGTPQPGLECGGALR